MKIEKYQYPKSSFLSINKDLDIIITRVLKNDRLQRLLYYTTSDPLKEKLLNEDQQHELLENNIKIVPKLYVDGSVLNYIIVSFDNFVPSDNPQFRDNTITFDIVCHNNQWQLKDFNLRPYRIAAEIDTLFNNTHMSGIGTLQFIDCHMEVINSEFSAVSLSYAAIHGGDDQKGMLNPQENIKYIEDFDRIYNDN